MNIRAYSVSYAWTVTTGSVYRFTTVQNITCGTCTPRLRRQISLYPCMSLIVSKQVIKPALNYTDVIVTPLFRVPNFLQKGLGNCGYRQGEAPNPVLCPFTFYMHGWVLMIYEQSFQHHIYSLTGCDITSNIGTKKAALNAEKRSTCTDLAQRLH